MIGNMLQRLPATHRHVDRHTDYGPNHPSLFQSLNAVKRNAYRGMALRCNRILWIAAAPIYATAMLANLIWVCLWLPDLEADADADDLGWDSAALGVAQLDAKRSDPMVAASKPSMN